MLRTHKKHPVARRFLCLYSCYDNSKSLGAKYDLRATIEVGGTGKLGFVEMSVGLHNSYFCTLLVKKPDFGHMQTHSFYVEKT